MKLWTYHREFELQGDPWHVEVETTFNTITSRVFRGDLLMDELGFLASEGMRTLVHDIALDGSEDALRVEMGYFNLWSVGIRVTLNERLTYESHPDEDIYAIERKFSSMMGGDPDEQAEIAKEQKQRWEKNKYSVYADIGLGLLFFAVGKLTGDLSTAAIIGAAAGLSLVVIQRFVKVDLLGGFAVFGTVMLLISAGFSLAFQSDFMVQIKGTVLGLMVASLMLADGIFRKGRFFGERIQRYLPFSIIPERIAIGMAAVGLLMAGLNYMVTITFSEDAWLTYTTFLDMPLSFILTYAVFMWAKGGQLGQMDA